jgi:predicted enzyme related to lactoylglutathione lyase
MPTFTKHAPGSFCWMELGTTDQNAAKKFYSDLLGWTVADMPMGPGEFYTIFKLNGHDAAAAYTLRKEQAGAPPHWMLYIASDDVDASTRRASELGAKVFAQPFDVFDIGRMAVLADPTGAMFSIWQAKKHIGVGIKDEDGAFCWADLSTPDVERVRDFYSKLFGWELVAGEKDPSGYLHIKNGEQFIGGVPPASHRDPNAPPHWLLYFATSNCDNSVNKAKQNGAKVFYGPVSMENVGRFAVLADPQGAVFSVFQSAMK